MGADELELLARSAYMLGRDDEYRVGLERAYKAHLEAGRPLRAVRCAFWIGHNRLFRGEGAKASGWFARAQRLLDAEEGGNVERGYLLIPVWLEQMGGKDIEAGLATAAEAETIGERFDDQDLVWLARDEQARALLKLGRASEGLPLVDEVLLTANAGELSAIVTGIIYCNTIAFCRDAFEIRRAREWTNALTEWCDRQPEMVAHNGLCLVHRAEMMQLQGAWGDALEEARRAAERFTRGVLNELAYGKALYRQGEVHRLRGELDAAETAFNQASRVGCEPQPGIALLKLARGDGDAAAASIRRAVGETVEPLKRAALLPTYAEIMLAVGDIVAAGTARRELERIASHHGGEVLEALSAHTLGAVALAEGNPREALIALRRAADLWRELWAPYECARTRILVGRACRSLGDEDGAGREFEAAHSAFQQLGAARELATTEVFEKADGAHGLTDRECEVLRLVAAGKRNREIAAELLISEHTVARHLQNIFAKLGVSSRTAASAFAFEHDLA